MTDELILRPSDAENLAGQDTGREHLSHSSIGTLLNCKQRFDYHYRQRLSPVQRPRPLGMGSAFQKAVELQDPHAGAALLREGVQIVSQEDENRLRVEETTVAAAATLYLQRWPASTSETREYEYRVRLRSPWTGRPSNTFDLLGYADGIIDEPGYLELIENKFVGRIDALTVRKLPLDRQVTLAAYGLWRATGKAVRKVHYRYVKKPSIKQKQNETLDEFCARLTADYQERPDFYSHAETLFRTDADLLRIEAELWTWAEELRHARRAGVHARNTSTCGDYGGCPFIPLCVGDPDAMSLYMVRPEREPDETTTDQPIAA